VVAVDIFTSRTARKTQQATRKGKNNNEKRKRERKKTGWNTTRGGKQKERFEHADLVCDAISNHRKSERKREEEKKQPSFFRGGKSWEREGAQKAAKQQKPA